MLFTYLHLAADRRAHRRAARVRHHRDRLRDRAAARRRAAAAGADERGRRAPGHAGRRAPPAERPTAAGRAARRGARRRAGAGRRARRRRRRRERGRDRRRACGADVTVLDINLDRLRHLDALYRRPRPHGRVQRLRDRARASLDADLLIGAVLVPGAPRAALVTQRAGGADEAGRGDRRRRDRPGRLLREHARRPPTTTRPTSCTASSSTASPTCRAPCRTRPPTR